MRRLILGRSHNLLPGDILQYEFQALATIPAGRKLKQTDNDSLLRPVHLSEIIAATAGLHRHKAAGMYGFNNDFYIDNQALLTPIMVTIGNELLRGKGPHPSFLKGLTIPL